jgi:hypothetical protein
MKNAKLSFIAVMAVVPALVMAESTISEKSVTFAGERSARKVCKAVMRDDPIRLRRILRDYQSTLVYAHSFKLTDHAIAGSYSCNGLPLAAFSEQMGAANTAYFLRTGKIAIEPAVASSGN